MDLSAVLKASKDVEFQDVYYTVTERKNLVQESQKRVLLHGVSGAFGNGQLSAIMGPSGAGKSSLLNAISGYRTSGVSGYIRINKKESCYITQEDHHQTLLTVEELMKVACSLKLKSQKESGSIITEILLNLNLNHRRDITAEKLSGGERKRLSIALELVANPSTFFLDEPTSGLDEVTAAQCVRLLRNLAKQGRTIVCTIHQPSATIFGLFDQIYVLAKGHCVYQGEPKAIIPFLSNADLHCPKHYSPSDFIIELCDSEDGAIIPTLTEMTQNGKLLCIPAGADSSLELSTLDQIYHKDVYEDGCQFRNAITSMIYDAPKISKSYGIGGNAFLEKMKSFSRRIRSDDTAVSSFRQFSVLLRVMWLKNIRNKVAIWIQFIHHIMCGLMFGLIFYKTANKGERMFDHLKYCIGCILVIVYTQVMVPVLSFTTKRQMDLKNLKKLISVQEWRARQIADSISNGKKRNIERRTLRFYENKIEELKQLWFEFYAAEKIIIELAFELKEIDNFTYLTENKFADVDNKYQDYMVDLKDGVKEKTPPAVVIQPEVQNQGNLETATAPTFHHTPLPRINLPSFNGDYNNWRSFHDLFVSVVHDNAMVQPVQKLHYLKGCLTGEAERLLTHVPITNEDYIPAWEKLKLRYENKRLLVNTQLKKLVNQVKLLNENTKGLRLIIDTTDECMQQLRALGVNVDQWNTLLIHILVQKLPITTIKLWEEELGDSQELPELTKFIEFLQTRARILESVSSTINEKYVSQQLTKNYHVASSTKHPFCPACNAKHFIGKYKKFMNMNPTKRLECIISSGRCSNCLSSKHSRKQCTNTYTCRKCSGQHHTLLHDPARENTTRFEKTTRSNTNSLKPGTNIRDNSNEEGQTLSQTFFNTKETNTLLATAQVIAKNKFGERVHFRCLVDPGSQASFITQRAFKKLGMTGKPTSIEINGLNQHETAKSKYQINIALMSCQDKRQSIQVNLLVINTITDALPSKTFQPSSSWTHIKGLKLADPTYWKSNSIDILLGVDAYIDILKNNIIKGPRNAPTAIDTTLGWILMGKGPTEYKVETFFSTTTTLDELNQNLIKFWETEEVPSPRVQNLEDAQCESHYQKTHKRLENGQYEVRLPFKMEPALGASRALAIKRLQYLQKKFFHNNDLEIAYRQCLDEYIAMGHMEFAGKPVVEIPGNYYIPHHAVIKESTTTKLRVVFDASAKSSNGKSLNDHLLTGPSLQPKLFSTLLKWRRYKIAITADIEKMYRMIKLHPDDQKYQKIMWIDPITKDMGEYKLKTVTFGTSSAPYLAIRTLLQLANDEKNNWPLASKAAQIDFYVDKLLSGADTLEEARELQHQCISMLKGANFSLRKWSSNHKEMLSHLPLEDVESKEFLQFDEREAIKMLGIQWVPQKNYFTFKIKNQVVTPTITKRKMLSEIASLYDPLGWIAPVIVVAKILMQQLWISGCTWDSEVDSQTATKFMNFKKELKLLETLKIPRWIGLQQNVKQVHIHGFCDASMIAYAAVVYLRIHTSTDDIITHMLTSKTRVAPIKPTTLPRLELSGTTLLAKLLKTTIHDMQLQSIPITAWTDSTITLQWIKSNPTRWKPYVANRIAEIQEYINPECWRHVPTQSNPADSASRGLSTTNLISNQLWWHGPEWLAKEEKYWPTNPIQLDHPLVEAKPKNVSMFFNEIADDQLFHNYSSFKKLQRIVARIKRFTFNANAKNKIKKTGTLRAEELKTAQSIICKCIQRKYFPEEYLRLEKGKELASNSRLLTLTPFMDESGVLRVGGRLANAMISFNNKHPIILPPNHTITTSIIDEIHKITLHGGTKIVLHTSRQTYWILNAKRVITKRINNWITCIRYKQKPTSQMMGNLPKVRSNISKPFANVGIDYAGPIQLKTSPHRSLRCYKGYFCIFVCMATKAVHLELVSDLTSIAFIAALKRFIARRGLCSNIYSDCGTNFKGAEAILDKELKTAIKEATSEAAKELLQKHTITWHFNPPSAPHFGGIWESGVKSVKYHLRRTIGKTILTFEEYSTLLTQIEACLNSRPLCPIENSTDDLAVLTPGHFLIGQPMNALPEKILPNSTATISKRWKHIQYMTQQFWKKWSSEYLNSLQQRYKWKTKNPNLEVGDLVLIKDDQTFPSTWPRARITQTFPGNDGLTRVVEIQTATTLLKRPISKLCLLPTEPEI